MRMPMVIGNWKMHGSQASCLALAEGIVAGIAAYDNLTVVLAPAMVHLPVLASCLHNSSVALAGQNLYPGGDGAVTGEVSAPMLRDLACTYVLIGHSERRLCCGETDELIAAKVQDALQYGLKPVLCIGETLAQRQANATEAVLAAQLACLPQVEHLLMQSELILAYEPVWAIGTGKAAGPEEIHMVHAYIRRVVSGINLAIANKMRILYGGSVNAGNVASIMTMPEVDGVLVGSAALNVDQFLEICAMLN